MAKQFPVKQVNNSSSNLIDRLAKECTNYGSLELFGAGIAPVSGSTTIVNQPLLPTETFYATQASFMLQGATKATVQIQAYLGPNNAGDGSNSIRYPLLNNGIKHNINNFITPGTQIKLNLRDGDGTTNLFVSCNIGGYRVSADTNYGAEKVIMWIGDSIPRGSNLAPVVFSDYAVSTNILAATTCEDHFAFQVKNNFQKKGIDCRLVTKAMGSYTSREMSYWLKQGFLNIDQVDCIFYQLSTNDATKGTTDQQFTDEINRVIDWRNRVYKNLPPIIFVGGTPLNNNTSETRLDQLRTIMSNIVASSISGLKLSYINLGTPDVFDRTVLSNYTASDGIHPNIANQLNMSAKINTQLASFTF